MCFLKLLFEGSLEEEKKMKVHRNFVVEQSGD